MQHLTFGYTDRTNLQRTRNYSTQLITFFLFFLSFFFIYWKLSQTNLVGLRLLTIYHLSADHPASHSAPNRALPLPPTPPPGTPTDPLHSGVPLPKNKIVLQKEKIKQRKKLWNKQANKQTRNSNYDSPLSWFCPMAVVSPQLMWPFFAA